MGMITAGQCERRFDGRTYHTTFVRFLQYTIFGRT